MRRLVLLPLPMQLRLGAEHALLRSLQFCLQSCHTLPARVQLKQRFCAVCLPLVCDSLLAYKLAPQQLELGSYAGGAHNLLLSVAFGTRELLVGSPQGRALAFQCRQPGRQLPAAQLCLTPHGRFSAGTQLCCLAFLLQQGQVLFVLPHSLLGGAQLRAQLVVCAAGG